MYLLYITPTEQWIFDDKCIYTVHIQQRMRRELEFAGVGDDKKTHTHTTERHTRFKPKSAHNMKKRTNDMENSSGYPHSKSNAVHIFEK